MAVFHKKNLLSPIFVSCCKRFLFGQLDRNPWICRNQGRKVPFSQRDRIMNPFATQGLIMGSELMNLPPLIEGGMIIIGTWLTQKAPFRSTGGTKNFPTTARHRSPMGDNVLGVVVSCATEYRMGNKPISLWMWLWIQIGGRNYVSLCIPYISQSWEGFNEHWRHPMVSLFQLCFPVLNLYRFLNFLHGVCVCMYYGTSTYILGTPTSLKPF